MHMRRFNKLLKAAKKAPARAKTIGKVTKDHVELVIALMKEEITASQFTIAIENDRPGNVGHYAYSILKRGLQNGVFKIVYK